MNVLVNLCSFLWLVSSYLDVASATEDDADLIQPAYRDRAHERREVALARLTAYGYEDDEDFWSGSGSGSGDYNNYFPRPYETTKEPLEKPVNTGGGSNNGIKFESEEDPNELGTDFNTASALHCTTAIVVATSLLALLTSSNWLLGGTR